ncbi:hypothetical protein [Ehrlichia chaffeensis]|nr:hypothetical protein [Ehrlichia chaffeensis]AHX09216.1 hypothetical protein ECHWAK_0664 [Ehrlichia chaffeensis str. Wakulla]
MFIIILSGLMVCIGIGIFISSIVVEEIVLLLNGNLNTHSSIIEMIS